MNFTPINMDAETFEKLANVAQEQSVGKRELSNDKNFPVYASPVNEKHLVYVPNFVVNEGTELEDVRKDRSFAHQVIDGKAFHSIRCTNGIRIEGSVDFDGNCPICEGTAPCWDRLHFEYEAQCRMKGLSPENQEDEEVKNVYRTCKDKMVIRSAEEFWTFPIVLVDTVTTPDGQISPKTNAEGNLTGTTYWYRIRKTTYEKRWKKALSSMMPSVKHPAGKWFLLDYTYDAKGGEHNKRDSANNLQITNVQVVGAYEYLKNYESMFDEQSAEFTPQKSMQTIYANMWVSKDELNKTVDRVLSETRSMVSLYQQQANGVTVAGSANQSSAEAMLGNFGGTEVPQVALGATPQPATTGAVPPSMGMVQ